MTAPATLAELMDAVAEALAAGDLVRAGDLAPALESALTGVGALPPDALHDLRRRAERNTARLEGARRGLLSARHRLSEVLETARGLATYDAAGRRAIAPSGGAVLSRW